MTIATTRPAGITTVPDFHTPISGPHIIFLSGSHGAAPVAGAELDAAVVTWLGKIDSQLEAVAALTARFSVPAPLPDAGIFIDAPDDVCYDDIDAWREVVVPVVTDDPEGFFTYSESDPQIWHP